MRTIDAAIWEDDFFAGLNMINRLIWIGLITTCADDQGRMQDNPALIRSKVFPTDDVSIGIIEAAIAAFAKERKVVRYEMHGKKLIQIVNWWKHQTPRWAGKSKYPAPSGWTDRVRYHVNPRDIIEENWSKKGGFTEDYIVDCIEDYTEDCTCPDVNDDVNDDVDDDDDGDEEVEESPKTGEKIAAAAAETTQTDDAELLSVFTSVTGWTYYPASEREGAIAAIRSLFARLKTAKALTDYLKPYYAAYRERYQSGARCFWLTDWAVAGSIPEVRPKAVTQGGNGANRKATLAEQEAELARLLKAQGLDL